MKYLIPIGSNIFQDKIPNPFLGGFGDIGLLLLQYLEKLGGLFVGLDIVDAWSTGFDMFFNFFLFVSFEGSFDVIEQEVETCLAIV